MMVVLINVTVLPLNSLPVNKRRLEKTQPLDDSFKYKTCMLYIQEYKT